MEDELAEVTLLYDARPGRPQGAVGVGEFWYEPGVWSLPLSPGARVLYAGLCSFLGHGEINRKDLRNVLKDRSDREILGTFKELVGHDLLAPDPSGGYGVRSVGEFG